MLPENPDQPSDSANNAPIAPRQVGELPIAPRTPPSRRLIAAIAGTVLAMVLLSGLALFIHNLLTPHLTATQVQDILNKAASAPLHAANFTLAANVNGSVAGFAASTTVTGNGKLTTNPNRVDALVQSPGIAGFGAINTEVIQDGSDIYTKNGSATKPWTKNSGILANLPGLSFTDLLDYQKLHNAQFIGEDTINGHKAWHLRAGLSDLITGSSAAATATAISQQSGAQNSLTEDLWIREDTYFPAQLTLTTKTSLASAGAGTAISGTINTDETLTFTAWNTGITITVPPPSEVQG